MPTTADTDRGMHRQVWADKRLLEPLKKYHDHKNRCLIFILYKREAGTLMNFLSSKGYSVERSRVA